MYFKQRVNKKQNSGPVVWNKVFEILGHLTLLLLNMSGPVLAKSVGSDQLASE